MGSGFSGCSCEVEAKGQIGEKVKDNKKDSYKDIFMSYDKKNSDKLIYIYEELKKFSVL